MCLLLPKSLVKSVEAMVLCSFLLGTLLHGQTIPSASIVSPSVSATPAIEIIASSDESSAAVVDPAVADPAIIDPASLLPDMPAVPLAKTTLIGGTVQRLNRVQDQLTLQTFGGGKMKISFDPRTHIYHDGKLALVSDLHQGDRVYVDTVLDGNTVFARSVRIKTATSAGENQGIVVSYRSDRGELVVRDALSPQPLKIHLTSQTILKQGDHSVSAAALVPGTLVSVKFAPQSHGPDVAQEVSLLAVPGTNFTFAGRVTGLDLRLGLLVLTASTDRKSYEIYFDASTVAVDDKLRPGVDVTALANFDGTHYVARSLTINPQ
jgi:hypothetical protein